MNIYYYLIHCNSIGDNIASYKKHYLTYKLAKENNRKIVSVIHMCTLEEIQEYIIKQNIVLDSFALNSNLIELYKKADLFNHHIVIEGINDRVNKERNDVICRIIKNFYGNRNTNNVDFIENYPDFWNICNNLKKNDIVNFYKTQYSFLKRDSYDYNIIQYCSNHYNLMTTDKYGKCVKRISFLNLCNWIENCEIKTFKFIGSYHDFVLTEEVINKLRIKYKDYNFINLCGEYDLEQTYSLIYN